MKTSKISNFEAILNQQLEFEGEFQTSLEVQVAHYTPACFPLVPVVNKRIIDICAQSWKIIMESVEVNGIMMSGMTVFYTEFYQTLEHFDKMGKFESVLRQHTSGMNSIAAKGAILIRIVNYALALDPDSESAMFMLFTLGKSHNNKRIRPWQYSIFIQTLVNTISSRLGAHATHEVMTAWSHLFAYLMRSILPMAIRGLVNETEVDANVTSEMSPDAVVVDEIEEADAFMQLRKKESRDASRAASRGASRAASRGASQAVSNAGSSANSPRGSLFNPRTGK